MVGQKKLPNGKVEIENVSAVAAVDCSIKMTASSRADGETPLEELLVQLGPRAVVRSQARLDQMMERPQHQVRI